MVSLDDLKMLGKEVMNAMVDAEMLGLVSVTEYLSLAFDDVAREASKLRVLVIREEGERSLQETGGG